MGKYKSGVFMMKNGKNKEKSSKRRIFSVAKIVIAILALIVFVTDRFMSANHEAAEKIIINGVYNIYYSVASTVSSIFPFSVAEIFLILILPVGIVAWIIWRTHQSRKAKGEKLRLLKTAAIILTDIAALGLLVYVGFVGTWTMNSYRPPMTELIGLEIKEAPTAKELAETASILIDMVNEDIKQIEFDENGFSVNPMSFKETAKEIGDCYDLAKRDYPCFSIAFGGKTLKPIICSKPYTYTFIMGIYTSVTGEGNINVNFPDFCIPHTMAHELSHGRRFIREDEANFIGFLVCMYSDEPYVRYSAANTALKFLNSDLHKADKELYNEVFSKLDRRVYGEWSAESAFLADYKTKVQQVSSQVNDAYLKAQGQDGTISYSYMVKWLCAYYAE